VSGLQNERNALAVQRTALSIAVTSAALSRLTYGQLGALSIVSAMFTAVMTGWLLRESRRRYLRSTDSRDGRAPAALAIAVLAMACTELTALWLQQ
jgi:hypothetical protein